jgi:hypothetical protein
MNDERRKHERKAWVSSINYQVSKEGPVKEEKLSLRGETSDISAGGLCITTDRLLTPGLVVAFGETRLAGVVRWGSQAESSYMAGIQLI